jgi:multisubunit Na+/H+ antiporter MnhE subunit
MSLLILYIIGTFTFAALAGFDLANVLAGAVVMAVILAVFPNLPPLKQLFKKETRDFRKALRLLLNTVPFLLDFLWDLTVSNLVLARDIWFPTSRYAPRFVEVPVQDLTRFQAAFLAARITLTPGTLSVAICTTRQVIVVHSMYPGGSDYGTSLRKPIDILLKGL